MSMSNWTPASALWQIEHGGLDSAQTRAAVRYLASLSPGQLADEGLLSLVCKLRRLASPDEDESRDPGPLIPGEVSGWRDGNDDEPFDYDASALLPTGQLMNPAHPEGARYYDRGQVAYVVTGPAGSPLPGVRVLTSFGVLVGWDLGSEHAIRHDQSCLPLGTWRVTGIRDYSAGALIAPLGTIPDRPLRHWVFK
jgi:hypothetical protein